jgi:hypothetical protein
MAWVKGPSCLIKEDVSASILSGVSRIGLIEVDNFKCEQYL